MADESAKRNRKANFTAAECAVILEEAEKNLDVIKNKFSTVLTNKKKNQVWEEIKEKVNSLGVCVRSVQEVKDKWRSMVSSAKKEHCKVGKQRKLTGGGQKPPSPKPATQKIIDLFSDNPSFSGISGGLESGGLTVDQELATPAPTDLLDNYSSSFQTIDATAIEFAGVDLDISGHQENHLQTALHQDDSPVLPEISVNSTTTAEGESNVSSIENKPKKRKVTVDEINAAHLNVIRLEEDKLKMEMQNLELQKQKLLLEIEEIKARKDNFIHES